MIQDVEPHVYRNEYVPEPPKEDSVILYYEGRKILVKLEDQEISFLTLAKRLQSVIRISMKIIRILFSIDGQGYYLTDGIDPADFPGFELKDNQYFREARPKYRQFAAVTGLAALPLVSVSGNSAATAGSLRYMTTKNA